MLQLFIALFLHLGPGGPVPPACCHLAPDKPYSPPVQWRTRGR